MPLLPSSFARVMRRPRVGRRGLCSDPVLSALDVMGDFVSLRLWDPWSGGLRDRAKLHSMVTGAGMGSWAVGREGEKG